MIDGRFGDEEWRAIVAAIGSEPDDSVRSALESAARRYLDRKIDRSRMVGSAKKRGQWDEIGKKASELSGLLKKIVHWDAPIWGSDGEPDNYRGDRTKTTERLNDLVRHASSNASDYKDHAERFAGKKDPDRQRLYVELLSVWTDCLGGELGVSNRKGHITGPLLRFFEAAVIPILGSSRPKPRSIRGIVEREKERRMASSSNADTLLPTNCNIGRTN